MKPSRSRDMLNALLRGDTPSEAEILTFVTACPHEDEWFDYKAGALLGTSKAADVVREYVSGFANAEGGFLVIGFDQATGLFDGASAPGGGALDAWAASVCRTLGTLPPARFRQLQASGVQVLLIGVDRAPNLIPVVKAGALHYHARFGDETLPLPPWMVSDLLVGRRARPELNARVVHVAAQRFGDDPSDANVEIYTFDLGIAIENLSLVEAENVRVGALTWGPQKPSPPSDSLLRYVDVVPVAKYVPSGLADMRLTHLRPAGASNIAPLAEHGGSLFERVPVRVFTDLLQHVGADVPPLVRAQARGVFRQSVAVYAIGNNVEPTWFQLTIESSQGLRAEHAAFARYCTIEPLYRERPRVAVEFPPV